MHYITREVSLFAIFSLIFIFIFLSNFITEFSTSLQALLPSIHFQVYTRPHASSQYGYVVRCYFSLLHIPVFLTVVLHTFGFLYNYFFVCHRAHLYFGFYLLSFLSAYLLMQSISKEHIQTHQIFCWFHFIHGDMPVEIFWLCCALGCCVGIILGLPSQEIFFLSLLSDLRSSPFYFIPIVW